MTRMLSCWSSSYAAPRPKASAGKDPQALPDLALTIAHGIARSEGASTCTVRFLSACLLATISGTSFGQMMGGPMSTAQYFPLVDGARYDYMYTSGPWATSTAVMRSGQTWAGVSGLTAMHTTYVCNAGVTCAPDATDFYRMDPDGMRYFGGTGANAMGTQFSMMTYTNPEWLLKNPGHAGDHDGRTGRRLPERGDVASRRHGDEQHDGRTELHEQLSGTWPWKP